MVYLVYLYGEIQHKSTYNVRFGPGKVLEKSLVLIHQNLWEPCNGYEMMHKAWSSIEEVPYCFSRSSFKFQGHIALKIVEFDSNWAFPDCNSSLNSLMAMKCCTKLEIAKKRCPIVSKVIHQISRSHGTKQIDFDPNWVFRTIGRSQLSNPSDLPCYLLSPLALSQV